MTKPLHHSYLLRFWRDHDGAPLRATLIVIGQPDTPQHFANSDELFEFLRTQVYLRASADDRTRRDADHSTPDDSC